VGGFLTLLGDKPFTLPEKRPAPAAGKARPGSVVFSTPISLRRRSRPRAEGEFASDSPLEGSGFELFVPEFSLCSARPAFLRRISARLSEELRAFRRTLHFRRLPVESNRVTSGPAEIDLVLYTPLQQSGFLGLVRKVIPAFEGAPPHQQILISAVSASSAEDVVNFVIVVG
jgi:hypothetical protein